jgi:hypothetical protein
MAEHKHGTMDITEQEKTFEGFVKIATRLTVMIILGLILLAMVNG